jgi:DDE superfamily endonuclease
MNDNQAIHEVDIGQLIENLPLGYCVLGDTAYTATKQLIPMYYGEDKLKPKFDNFNFYGSQLRIRIEMAFGMMTRKWGIYWRPLLVGLVDQIKYIVEVIARLHNFCINKRILEAGNIDPVVEANVTGQEIFQDTAEALAEYEALAKDLPGVSANHNDMTKRIENLDLAMLHKIGVDVLCPDANLIANIGDVQTKFNVCRTLRVRDNIIPL